MRSRTLGGAAMVFAAAGLLACTREQTPRTTQPAPQATAPGGSGVGMGPGMGGMHGGMGGMHGGMGGMHGGMGGMHGMAGMCPMYIEGAHVSVEDTPKGVALTFTTSTGHVAELRARVREMAAMASGAGPGMQGGGGPQGGMRGQGYGPGMGGRGMGMVPSEARVIDIANGARLELTPRDPNQLSALRARAHMHAEMMASGQCPRMGEGA